MSAEVTSLVSGLQAAAANPVWRGARRIQQLTNRLRGRADSDALLEAATLLRRHAGRRRGRRADDVQLLVELDRLGPLLAAVGGSRTVRVAARVDSAGHAGLLDALAEIGRVIGRVRADIAGRIGPSPADGDPTIRAALAGLSFADWPAAAAGPPLVDIVVPVYRDRAVTLRCLFSVLSAVNRTPYRLHVLDDHSPEPELSRDLDALAALGRIVLSRNDRNLGFVGTVNRGFTAAQGRDVLLLNSDTEVYGDWLDRLRAAAHRAADIGTVTPLSNNATIFSYPYTVQENAIPADISPRDLDRLAAAGGGEPLRRVPTGVGFCMYVRADCLAAVGGFDEAAFGRGYGEENDFCVRAAKRGFVNVAATDCFVLHCGGVSFAGEADGRKAAAMRVLRQRHPEYEPDVHRFIAADPLAPARRRLDAGRLRRAHRAQDRRPFLFVSHDAGGGTDQHIDELAAFLATAGRAVIVLRPQGRDDGRLALQSSLVDSLPNAVFAADRDWDELVALLRDAQVAHVHFHHLIDLPPRVRDLPALLGVGYDVTIHDYFPLCPRINLIDADDRFCDVGDERRCNRCVEGFLPRAPLPGGVGQWRGDHAAFLRAARRRFAPSADTAGRLERHLPGLGILVRPHFDRQTWPPATAAALPTAPPPKRGTRVAVLGALNEAKGALLLRDCALDADRRRLALEFMVLGYVFDPALFAGLRRCTILGPYHNDELGGWLRQLAPDCCFFPAIWPETYCYTLSAAIAYEVLPVVLDLGAPAERVRAMGWGELIARDATPAAINDRLMALTARPLAADQAQRAFGQYRDPADYYDWPQLIDLP